MWVVPPGRIKDYLDDADLKSNCIFRGIGGIIFPDNPLTMHY